MSGNSATIVVTPPSATVADGGTQQFSAVAVDQCGNVSLPSFSWSIDAGGIGNVDGTGIYTAPDSGTGTATVRATFVSVANLVHLSGTALVTVTAPLVPPVPVPTAASDPAIAGILFSVSTRTGTTTDPEARRRLPPDGAFLSSGRGTPTFSDFIPYAPADQPLAIADVLFLPQLQEM